MSATNIDNDFLNEDNLPIPIPPAKDGWADMERRLNATPPALHVKKRSQLLLRAAMIAGMIAIVSAALAIAYHFLFHSHQESSLVPSIIAPKNNNQTTNNSTGDILTTDTLQQAYASLPPSSTTNANSGKAVPSGSGVTVRADSVTGSATVMATHSATANGHTGNTPASHRAGITAVTASPSSDTRTASSPNTYGKGDQKNKTTGDTNGDTPTDQRNTSPEKNNGDTQTSQRSTSPEKTIHASNGTTEATNTTTATVTANALQSLPLVSHELLTKQPPSAVSTNWHRPHVHALPEWQLFLQWQLPVPLAGSNYYFHGPDGNNQFYRPLIPGIRGMRTWNANSISLDLTPFTAQTYNSPVIKTASTTDRDSSTTQVTNTLQKEFGASAALLYHRRILSHWQIGAGIQFNYWMQRSVNEKTVHYARWTGRPTDSSYTTLKESIHRPELKIPLEIYYDASRWQAGVRVDMPVFSKRDSLTSDIKTPVQLQLMLRYKLLPRRKSSIR